MQFVIGEQHFLSAPVQRRCVILECFHTHTHQQPCSGACRPRAKRNSGTPLATASSSFCNISSNWQRAIRERHLLTAMRHSGAPLPTANAQFESITGHRHLAIREHLWQSQHCNSGAHLATARASFATTHCYCECVVREHYLPPQNAIRERP